MNSIVLVGPRCCGKTSVGLELSRKLELPFVDADHVFEREYGTISSFVKKHNWERFREYESKIIDKICTDYRNSRIVLTPGGGAVAHNRGEQYRQSNVRVLRDFGKIFYLLPVSDLEESARILTPRLIRDPNSANSRPSLTEEDDKLKEMMKTLNERHPLYLAAAHEVVYTEGQSIKEVAEHIYQKLQ